MLLLLLSFFLRPDHHKVHDNEDEYQWHKKRADAAAWDLLRRRALSLSENRLEHAKNWIAHLKRESAHCNRSFASLVLLWEIDPATGDGLSRKMQNRLSLDEKRHGRANLRFADNGGIAQLVERLVRNEYQSVTLTFSHLLLSALS